MDNRSIGHLILIAFLVVSCKAAWHRTSLSSWVRQPVQTMGIDVEVPTDIAKAIRYPSSTSSAWFFPAGVEDEDAYIMIIASKTTADEMKQEALDYERSRGDIESVRHAKWQYTLHPLTSHYDESECRRDVQLPNGAIVRLQAYYTDFQFSPAERRDDAATINRILSSARPIETSSDARGR